MWDSYKKYSGVVGEEYDDEIIRESIVATHRLAHEVIEDFYPDSTVRLPNFVVPEGETETSALTKMCIEGLKERICTNTLNMSLD